MWDPVVPTDSRQTADSAAQTLPEEVDATPQPSTDPEKSSFGTFGEAAVDTAQMSQKGTLDAVPKGDHRKKYLEEVRNERNVASTTKQATSTQGMTAFGGNGLTSLRHLLRTRPQRMNERPKRHLSDVLPEISTSHEKREQLLRVEALTGQMLEQLGDSQSRPYYRLVARAFLAADLERLIHQALSDVKEGDHLGT